MKPIKSLLTALVLGLAVINSRSQATIPSDPTANTVGEWLGALSSTNLTVGTYGLYDLTTKTAGAGVFGLYNLNNYVGGLLKLDYINHETYSVRGNVQLQFPVKLNSRLTLIPYSFGGVGTALGGKGGDNGGVVYIGALGAALQITPHFGVFSSYERWTGGGFADNMVSIGAAYRF